MRTGHSAWNGHRTIHTQTSFLYTETLSRGLDYCGTQSTLAYCKGTVYPTLIRTGRQVGICVPCWNAKDISTRYSQVVTHPSTNPAQSCLTSVIRREPVHSAWYGLRTVHSSHKHLLNTHTLARGLGYVLWIRLNIDMLQKEYVSYVEYNILEEKEAFVHTVPVQKRPTALGITRRSPILVLICLAQCCLTSVIRREPVHSQWYGHRTRQQTQRHILHRNHVKTEKCNFGKRKPAMMHCSWKRSMVDTQWRWMKGISCPLLAWKRAYSALGIPKWTDLATCRT